MAIINHILVIGFHHKKGSVVEYVYPELESGTELPPEWSHIPSIALPDGAHNFEKDSVYFTVPSLLNKSESLFGIASYRQMDTKDYSSRTSESTRNTIQKSIVLLSRVPLFGYILTHLDTLTDQFVTAPSIDLGYTCLRNGFIELQQSLNSLLRNPSLYETSLYHGLSAVAFLRVYQRDVLLLLKLLLLERKILFTCDIAVNYLSTWILTLISLLPDIFMGGLQLCASVDDTWIGDRSCWPIAVHAALSASNKYAVDEDRTNVTSNEEDTLESKSSLGDKATTNESPPATAAALNSKQSNSNFWSSLAKSASALSARVQEAVSTQPPSKILSTGDPSKFSRDPSARDPFACLPPVGNDGLFDSFLPSDDWGLPLALFSLSYLLLPYVPLNAIDVLEQRVAMNGDEMGLLNGSRVRGFLAGTTNPLLSQNPRLAEVVVKTLPFDFVDLAEEQKPREPFGHAFSDTSTVEEDVFEQSSIVSDISGSSSSQTQSTKSNSVFSRLMHRAPSAVSLPRTQPEDTSRKLRATPVNLSSAIQLSRMDRIFVDHLVHTVELWYAARHYKSTHSAAAEPCATSKTEGLVQERGGNGTQPTQGPEVAEKVEQCDSSVLDERVPLNNQQPIPEALAHSYTTVLTKFPALVDLENWIRAQFAVYIKALLLSADGQGAPVSDFTTNYIICLRATHSFLVWRNQYVAQRLFDEQEGNTVTSRPSNDIEMEAAGQSSANSTRPHSVTEGGTIPKTGSLPAAVAYAVPTYSIPSVWIHPGKCCPSHEASEQIVQNLKQFGSIAADHGRKVVNHCVNSIIKMSSDQNVPANSNFAASLRSGINRLVVNLQSALNTSSDPSIES